MDLEHFPRAGHSIRKESKTQRHQWDRQHYEMSVCTIPDENDSTHFVELPHFAVGFSPGINPVGFAAPDTADCAAMIGKKPASKSALYFIFSLYDKIVYFVVRRYLVDNLIVQASVIWHSQKQ